MSELTIKLGNLQCTLTDPVSAEDIRAAYCMVSEIISDVNQLEERLKFQIEANDKLNNRRPSLEAKIAKNERKHQEFVQSLSKRDE